MVGEPARGDEVDAAVRAAMVENGRDAALEEVRFEQRRADALVLMAESALAGGLDPGTRGDRYQVVVHADAEALPAGSESGSTWLDDGSHVSAETCRRLACDAAVVGMQHGADGGVLAVGRRTRSISPGLRRALEHRDRGCRFPGCGAKLCDAHHVRHWADGGETSLANTVLLCRRHHRAVHEEGFSMQLDRSGRARFYRPDGRSLPQAPALPALAALPGGAGGPAEMLALRLLDGNVAVDAPEPPRTWRQGIVDYNWEIEWLLHLRDMAPGRSGGERH